MRGFLVWWNLEVWPRIDYSLWLVRKKWMQIPIGRKIALVLILMALLLISFRGFAHNEAEHTPPTNFDGYTILGSPSGDHMVACAPTTDDNGLSLCYPFRVSPMNVVEIGDHGWCRLEDGGAECASEKDQLLK